MTSFRVKVCGITRPQDALMAAELGADLIGLIFYRRSPRFAEPHEAEENFFWRVMDYLRRPQYVTSNAILQMTNGDFNPYTLLRVMGEGVTGKTKTEGFEIVDAIQGHQAKLAKED